MILHGGFSPSSTTNLSARRYNFPAQLFVGKNRKFGTIKRIVKKSLKFDSSTHQPRTARIRPRLGAILVFHKKRAIELRYAIKRTLFPRFLIQKSYYSKMPPISESFWFPSSSHSAARQLENQCPPFSSFRLVVTDLIKCFKNSFQTYFQ